MTPCIAIIESDVLAAAGLRVLLGDMSTGAEILAYPSVEAFIADSDREKDILVLLVQGLINKEIADRLGIAVTTVIFHRNNICTKLGTRSVGRMTIYAVLAGLVDVSSI